RMFRVKQKKEAIDEIISFFKNKKVEPAEVNELLISRETPAISERIALYQLLLRPQLNITDFGFLIADLLARTVGGSPIWELEGSARELGIADFKSEIGNPKSEILEEAEIMMKYEGYIQKEQEQVAKMS